MKKLLALLAVAGSSVVTFAEGETSGSTPDFSAATLALNNLSTSLGSWVTTALPILVGIGSAFLAFWLVRLVFRLVKSWGNAAK